MVGLGGNPLLSIGLISVGNPDWWDMIFLPRWILTIAAILVPRRVLHRVGWFCPSTMPVTTKVICHMNHMSIKSTLTSNYIHIYILYIYACILYTVYKLDQSRRSLSWTMYPLAFFVVIKKVTQKNCTDRGPLKTMSGFFYKKTIFGDAGLSFWSGEISLQISTVSLKFWGH